jgi:hypothetical protein
MNSENLKGNEKKFANWVNDIDPSEYTLVLKKFLVDSNFLYLVTASFNEILPCLLEGLDYAAEDLIGAEFWANLSPLAQRKAHLCLKHLATMPGTRLTDMANESCNKTTFRID